MLHKERRAPTPTQHKENNPATPPRSTCLQPPSPYRAWAATVSYACRRPDWQIPAESRHKLLHLHCPWKCLVVNSKQHLSLSVTGLCSSKPGTPLKYSLFSLQLFVIPHPRHYLISTEHIFTSTDSKHSQILLYLSSQLKDESLDEWISNSLWLNPLDFVLSGIVRDILRRQKGNNDCCGAVKVYKSLYVYEMVDWLVDLQTKKNACEG